MRGRLALAVVAALVGGAAQAADEVFVPKSGLSGTDFDWAKKENYVNAAADPGAGDIVALPEAFTNRLAFGSANWTFLSQLKAVYLGADTELTLEVAGSEEVAELGLPITAYYPNFPVCPSATLKKTGAGELYLSSFGNKLDSAYRDYYSNLKVAEGTLKLTQKCTEEKAQFYFYSIDIAEGATLYTVNANSDATVGGTRVYTSFLTGAGTIRSDSPSVVQYVFVQNNTPGSHSVFDGKAIGPKLQFYVIYTRLDFTNPDNAAFAAVVMDGGAVHGWTYPASTKGWNVVGETYGGTWKYLGTEPCTYAGSAWLTAGYNGFDGGEFGGVTFAYSPGNCKWSVSTAKQTLIELKGSNTVNECVVDTALNLPYAYIRKVEPGIWRFTSTDAATRRNAYSNGFAVVEGTLRFDSIAEAGTACALGMGNAPTEEPWKYGSTIKPSPADYVFKLGSFDVNSNAVEGVLELTGTTTADRGFVCGTRPIALKSTGVLKVPDIETALQFGGVSALDKGEKRLVLDGDNVYDNVVSNITDGAGTVSLEKRGSGKWTVRGDLRIHGDLDVRAGTLVLENTEAKARYTRYRFYMKETAYGNYKRNPEGYYKGLDQDEGYKAGGRQPQVMRLYLYDKDGNVVTRNLSTNSYPYMLEPGKCTSAGPNRCGVYSKTDFTLKGLFECSTGDKFSCVFAKEPEVDKPETWGCVEFALPENAAEVVGYDVRQGLRLNFSYSTRILTAWELHGSADGRQWHKLHGVEDFEASRDAATWCCDKTTGDGIYGTKRDLAAHPIYTFTDGALTTGDGFSQLGQIRSVSVAKGAKLVARGKTPEAIAGLTIAEAGMGELENIVLDEKGTVDLVLANPRVPVEIETSLDQVATGANITKWAVRVNGRPKTAKLGLAADGTLTYHPDGLMLLVR